VILLVACAGHQPVASGVPPAKTSPSVPAQGKTGIERPAPGHAQTAVGGEDPDQYHLRMLALAQAQFETFIRKAGAEPRFADAVQRSRDHIEDIRRMREFIAAGLEERRSR
jgi:hypothetical protein